MHYFGPWSDPDGALKKYLEQREDLHAGRKPREATEGLTVKELCNRFLNAKQALVDVGELSPLTWSDYKRTCIPSLVPAAGAAQVIGRLPYSIDEVNTNPNVPSPEPTRNANDPNPCP